MSPKTYSLLAPPEAVKREFEAVGMAIAQQQRDSGDLSTFRHWAFFGLVFGEGAGKGVGGGGCVNTLETY